jgi:hypothetical protein
MPRPVVDDDSIIRDRASKLDCDVWSLKPRCYPNTPARQIPLSIHQDARDMARGIAATNEYCILSLIQQEYSCVQNGP